MFKNASPQPAPAPGGLRERMLASARRELAERGREAASVRVIAERAGATAAMINYYFGGKQALCDAVLEEAEARLFTRLSAAVPADLSAAEPGALAAALAGAYFDFLAEDRELQRLFLREVLDGGERARALGRHVAPLRGLLARTFGRREEVTQLAMSLFGAVAGYFLYEPLLGELLGGDPLSPAALRRRKRHVMELARALAAGHTKEKHT